MESVATQARAPIAKANVPYRNLSFFEFVGWALIYFVVSLVAEGIGRASILTVEHLPPAAAPDVYDAIHHDLQVNVGHVIELLVWLAISTSMLLSPDRSHRPGLPAVFAVMAGARATCTVLLVLLCPGLLTGTLTSLRWSTRDEYRSAHLDWWSLGVVAVIALALRYIVVRRQRRSVV